MDFSGIKKIVVLTGAGISAESGISTFRDNDGLWENHRIEDVATPEAFKRNPDLVYSFYNKRRAQLLSQEIKPNAAHQALAKLEMNFSGEVVIVTQNVDNLHERGASENVIHMHGELLKMRCQETGKVYGIAGDLTEENVCSCCNKNRTLRPHIVWFGEMPMYMGVIERHLRECDLFISVGTSGLVYPAAIFVQWVHPDKMKIEVNLDSTNISAHFDYHLTGKAGEEIPRLVEMILETT